MVSVPHPQQTVGSRRAGLGQIPFCLDKPGMSGNLSLSFPSCEMGESCYFSHVPQRFVIYSNLEGVDAF